MHSSVVLDAVKKKVDDLYTSVYISQTHIDMNKRVPANDGTSTFFFYVSDQRRDEDESPLGK